MTSRKHDGIEVRHSRACRSSGGGRCSCTPGYRAEAYDARTQKRVRRTFPTLAAAKAWRTDAQTAIRRGTMQGPSGMTLREAAEDWMTQAREGAVRNRSGAVYKPSALRGYEAALHARVLPALGGLKLEDVRRRDVQALVDRMLGEGLHASTIRNLAMPLRVIFRWAVRRELVALNPCDGLELPALAGVRDRVATPEEAAALVAALPPQDGAVWATAFYSGLRAGELMALDWSCVDLGAGVIRVERAWDPKAREYVAPKSKPGRRKVPIPLALRDPLVEHKMRTGGQGLVFGRRNGTPFHASVLARRAAGYWKAAGLAPITLHECRHTFASLMIAAGVNGKALSTYMGHANIAITFDRYGHLMPGNENEAAARLDCYLAAATTR
jgi:integrase